MDEKEYYREVKDYEKKLQKILKDVNLSYPKPLNSREERKKFFKAIADDTKYNPQFRYEQREYDDNVILELKKLKKEIKVRNDLYGFKKLLKDKIDEKINTILLYKYWGHEKCFPYNEKVMGKPNFLLLLKAKKFCRNFKREKVRFTRISSRKLGNELKKEVKRLTRLKVRVEYPQLANKLNISPIDRVIRINPSERYTTLDLRRLSVHEIGTHFLRYYNAKKYATYLLQSGTAGYSHSEEGLAVYTEELKGVLSKAQMYIYAGRVIATYYTSKMDFYDLYNLLKEYGYKDRDAFTIAFRAKRNICDTSIKGGYTRDFIYFHGYYEIKKYAKKNDIKALYLGKFSLKDVKYIKKYLNKYKDKTTTILEQ